MSHTLPLVRRASVAVGLLGLQLVAVPAHAQWTLTAYYIPTNVASVVFAGSGNQPAGLGLSGNNQSTAVLWATPAFNSTILNPFLCVDAGVWGAAGSIQVGDAIPFGFSTYHAALWSGTPESLVDLNPAGAMSSSARATTGSVHAGVANFGTGDQAGLWTGSAASWTNLNPTGSDSSIANAAAGARQGGKALFGIQDHAGIWSGTAASWVDLDPPGSNGSEIFGMSPTRQGGRVYLQGAPFGHAAIWSGTRASFVDLHPSGALSSEVRGVLDGPPGLGRIQVGTARLASGESSGIMWSGTAASALTLNTLLVPPYTASSAFCVWTDATTLYIGGMARNDDTGGSDAVVWRRPLPPPPPCPVDFDGDGSVAIPDIFAFLAAWFAQQPAANFNHSAGIDVQDIFDFLAAWFVGCP